jgi:hypothetical protein
MTTMGLLDQLFASGSFSAQNEFAPGSEQEALLAGVFRHLQAQQQAAAQQNAAAPPSTQAAPPPPQQSIPAFQTAVTREPPPTADFMQGQSPSDDPRFMSAPDLFAMSPVQPSAPQRPMPTGHIMPESAPAPMPERPRVAAAPRQTQPELSAGDRFTSFNRALEKDGIIGGLVNGPGDCEANRQPRTGGCCRSRPAAHALGNPAVVRAEGADDARL